MRKILHIAVCLVVLFCFCLKPQVVFAWGDSDGGRDTYSLEQISEGVLDDKITFNSISIKETDYDWYKAAYGRELPAGTITEEVNYVGARVAGENNGTSNIWNGNEIEVEDGQTYLIRLYVHNDNPNGYDAIAEDTTVSFNIPQDTATSIKVNGYICSSNASPAEYVDYVNFNADQPFHLEYVYGSAFLENNGIAADGGVGLSDDIVKSVSGGVLIGYDALDGKIPGGYQYAAYVGIEVKAVFDYSYTTDTQVRLADTEDETWQNEITAEIGDIVEYRIAYTNTDNITQEEVSIRSVLPNNMEYVAGSTMLYNANHPNGVVGDTDDLVSDNGINIGSYTAGSNAIVVFSAKVVNVDLAQGSNTLVNWGQVAVGETVLQDYACVVVQNGISITFISIVLLILALIFGIIYVVLRVKIYRQKRRF